MSLGRQKVLGLAALLLAAGACALAARLPVAAQRAYDLGPVPTSAALRWASFGHPTLAANLWWLRAVQYMGDPRADQRGWEKLFPALDLVTDLDPAHGYAYQVGGNMLASAGRVGESNRLLEKGIAQAPDRYLIPFQRAVNAFLYEGDYAEAGAWFRRAAQVPGAPSERMLQYAAAMYAKGSAHDTGVALLQDLLRSAEDEESRKAVRKQLQQVLLERDASRLELAAADWRARYGFAPVALSQLVRDDLIAEIPADPFGGVYYLAPDGRVRSSASEYRYEAPMSAAQRAALIGAASGAARAATESAP
ncbi:hypothetical protein [Anaeromyxobacter dehalogenans]|uniref:Tetratricopeptide repeat protein n=1 Tax=Anaeromyxobacter dehalogenans (strain 2CP-C) TaxID=290397 RepID=Q2INM5_ANADE|nr:hypothetical protein [Anaeromyxobacter dehalogenans]ABC80410.1 hypothetical protein Adeh_0634 [Anaeromyxobacter dehalogenans 2CP-C]